MNATEPLEGSCWKHVMAKLRTTIGPEARNVPLQPVYRLASIADGVIDNALEDAADAGRGRH